MPHPSISTLNRELARKGETIVFVRESYTEPPKNIPVRAFVRGYKPEELSSGITQDDSKVIFGPDKLTAEGVTPEKGDLVVIGGRTRNVNAVGIFRIGEEIVRFELQVAG